MIVKKSPIDTTSNIELPTLLLILMTMIKIWRSSCFNVMIKWNDLQHFTLIISRYLNLYMCLQLLTIAMFGYCHFYELKIKVLGYSIEVLLHFYRNSVLVTNVRKLEQDTSEVTLYDIRYRLWFKITPQVQLWRSYFRDYFMCNWYGISNGITVPVVLSKLLHQCQAAKYSHGVFIIIDHEAREIMYLVGSVRPFVCPSVDTLTVEPSAVKSKKSHYLSVCLKSVDVCR